MADQKSLDDLVVKALEGAVKADWRDYRRTSVSLGGTLISIGIFLLLFDVLGLRNLGVANLERLQIGHEVLLFASGIAMVFFGGLLDIWVFAIKSTVSTQALMDLNTQDREEQQRRRQETAEHVGRVLSGAPGASD